ncbi:MAG: DUF4954 family protein [Bacteroidaceae bacterium]|nr:DUF4954 family protein [Bacteroidaceae bacterium]
MPDNYRSLSVDEINQLQQQGCYADDWLQVNVAEDFTPDHIHNVSFYGEVNLGVFDSLVTVDEEFRRHSALRNATLSNVTIGDRCLIENIGTIIRNYQIGDDCIIQNVGTLTAVESPSFGQGETIAVLNEAGNGNLILFDGLSSQLAALMTRNASNSAFMEVMQRLVQSHLETTLPETASIGNNVRIANVAEINNTLIGDDCEIGGALRIANSSLLSTPDSSVWIGSGVICEGCVIAAGASVTDGAKLANCFVGEACHVGKGFSAEQSAFFANSHMDNGEACAALCGPFSASHHKSTLLIGGEFSFYNAGSATNQSNHAYKMGPIHYGQLNRGSKTASGAHILWPFTSGAFSMLMGKITTHDELTDLPFSYIFGDGRETSIVPGVAFTTIGTWRDAQKWQHRDHRPVRGRSDLIIYNFLSPFIIQSVIDGLNRLKELASTEGEDAASYNWNGATISNRALKRGIKIYKMILRIYFGRNVRNGLPYTTTGTGRWIDLLGLLAPQSEIDEIVRDICDNAFTSVDEVSNRLRQLYDDYNDYVWTWTYKNLTDYYQTDILSDSDIESIRREGKESEAEWHELLRADAQKEFEMGDVDETTLKEFIAKIGKERNNK